MPKKATRTHTNHSYAVDAAKLNSLAENVRLAGDTAAAWQSYPQWIQFTEILSAYAHYIVHQLPVSSSWSHHDKENLAQEACINAFINFGKFNPTRPFTAWMQGVISHKAVDIIRHKTAKRRDDVSMPFDELDNPLSHQIMDHRHVEPATFVSVKDLSEGLVKHMKGITSPDERGNKRGQMLKGMLENNSVREIAENMDMTLPTARWHAREIRKQAASFLKKQSDATYSCQNQR